MAASERLAGFARPGHAAAGFEPNPSCWCLVALAAVYGLYGTRSTTAILRNEGCRLNHERVERIWRRDGLKVPRRAALTRLFVAEQRHLRAAAGHAQGPCLAYDFVTVRIHDGRPLHLLVTVDEFTCKRLLIDVARSLTSDDVFERLSRLMAGVERRSR